MPRELDVPHWAVERVKDYRESLELSAAVTDRMIYARLLMNQDMSPEDLMESVQQLETEVAEKGN